jgi:hypothetical protein
LYTSNFTPSATPLSVVANTVLLTAQSNRFIDNSTNNYAISIGGNAPKVATQNPFQLNTGISYYFDGTGDYLNIPDTTTFRLTGDFTVEAWVYRSVSANQTIISMDTTSTGGYAALRLDISGSDNKVYLLVSTSGSAWAINAGSTNTIVLNTWTHVAAVRSGTTVTLYLNGVSNASGTASGALYAGTIQLIGATNNAGISQTFTGYITDLRVTNGYARYTTTFTPPTTLLAAN